MWTGTQNVTPSEIRSQDPPVRTKSLILTTSGSTKEEGHKLYTSQRSMLTSPSGMMTSKGGTEKKNAYKILVTETERGKPLKEQSLDGRKTTFYNT